MPYACRSHIGKTHDRNEDSVLGVAADGVTVLAVADGLGGHPAGHIASETALQAFEDELQQAVPGFDRIDAEVLVEAFQAANRAVREKADANPEYHDMGSTLVAAVVQDGEAVVGNVGDSRAYRIAESIEQITDDQVDKVFSGVGGSRSRTRISQAVGLEEELDVDVYRADVADATLLLCSDGLSDDLGEKWIYRVVSGGDDLDEVAGKLIDYTLQEGGGDDITVALYR